MSYPEITRELNKPDMLKAVLTRIKERKTISSDYNILSVGLFENVLIDEVPCDVAVIVVCDHLCNESKITIKLADLDLTPTKIFNYYLYRFDISKMNRGDAIRVVKEATDTDPDHFAYNAILIDRNVRQISYLMLPSRGPEHRILTARQAYHHGVKVYVYSSPDDYVNVDNIDNGCHCDMIK